jgi:WD40 repeat protein
MKMYITVLSFLVFGASPIYSQEVTTTPAKSFGYGIITSNAALSPDGRTFLTGSSDGIIRMWDVSSGEIRRQFVGHTDKVTRLAYSPDGSRILSGAGYHDQTAKLWDTNGVCLRTLEGHTRPLSSVAFSPDGLLAVTGSSDGTARLWNLDTGDSLLTIRGEDWFDVVATLSPDGNSLLYAQGTTITLWSVPTGDSLLAFKHFHRFSVTSLAFSPDGRYFVSGSRDSAVLLWESDGGSMPDFPIPVHTFEGHGDVVTSAAFSPDGQFLATGSQDKTVKIWDMQNGNCVNTFTRHSSGVASVAFSTDGLQLLSATGDLSVNMNDYTAESLVLLWERENPRNYEEYVGHGRFHNAAAMSPDGSLLAMGGSEGLVTLWDPQSLQCVGRLRGHTGAIITISFSPDGSKLLTGSADRTATLWDIGARLPIRSTPVQSNQVKAAFFPDGKSFLTASQEIFRWDVDKDSVLSVLHNPNRNLVSAVAISADGLKVVADFAFGNTVVWDASSGDSLLTAQTQEVRALAISPDGSSVLTGSLDGSVILWDIVSAIPIRSFQGAHRGPVQSLAFSPDGRRVAVGARDTSLVLSGGATGIPIVVIYDVATGANVHMLKHQGPISTFMSGTVSFISDGTQILSTSFNNPAMIWNISTNDPVQIRQGFRPWYPRQHSPQV